MWWVFSKYPKICRVFPRPMGKYIRKKKENGAEGTKYLEGQKGSK
jgi:hypothetical protein